MVFLVCVCVRAHMHVCMYARICKYMSWHPWITPFACLLLPRAAAAAWLSLTETSRQSFLHFWLDRPDLMPKMTSRALLIGLKLHALFTKTLWSWWPCFSIFSSVRELYPDHYFGFTCLPPMWSFLGCVFYWHRPLRVFSYVMIYQFVPVMCWLLSNLWLTCVSPFECAWRVPLLVHTHCSTVA